MVKSNIVFCVAGPLIHQDKMGCLEFLLDIDKILVPDIKTPDMKLVKQQVFTEVVSIWEIDGEY